MLTRLGLFKQSEAYITIEYELVLLQTWEGSVTVCGEFRDHWKMISKHNSIIVNVLLELCSFKKVVIDQQNKMF